MSTERRPNKTFKKREGYDSDNNIESIRPIEYIKPFDLNDLINNKPSPKEYALFPILPIQGIVFVYAATGVGKTLFTMNMAYAISGGGNFLKYSAPKPRKVLYIDGEMAYVDIYDRLMLISKQQGALDFPDNFLIYTPDKFMPDNFHEPIKMPKICDNSGQEFYKKAIEKNNVDLIVIDNLSMLSRIDLDSGEEWNIVQDWLLSLRALGKTIIVVHHAGKDKMGYRGSSRMLDAVDTAISLQPIDEVDNELDLPQQKKFKIVYHKHRSFYGVDASSYEVTLLSNIWSYRSIELSNLDKVIESVLAGMKQCAIAKELGISQPTVNRLIKKARSIGRLPS